MGWNDHMGIGTDGYPECNGPDEEYLSYKDRLLSLSEKISSINPSHVNVESLTKLTHEWLDLFRQLVHMCEKKTTK